MIDAVWRTHLTTPGEPLLLPRSVLEQSLRLQLACEVTCPGIDPALSAGRWVFTQAVAQPLPRYPASAEGFSRRQWLAGVDPTAAWHPLLWLPESVWARIETPESLEDDLEWALRIAAQAQIAGLYREQDATWFDPLAEIGIDVDTDQGQARVRDWLAGAPDFILDTLDVGLHLEAGPSPLDLALVLAPITGDVAHACDALVALDLLHQITQPTQDHVALHELTTIVTQLALGVLETPAAVGPWQQIATTLAGVDPADPGAVRSAHERVVAQLQALTAHTDHIERVAAALDLNDQA